MSEVTDDATEPTSDVVPLLVPRDGVPDVITTAAGVADAAAAHEPHQVLFFAKELSELYTKVVGDRNDPETRARWARESAALEACIAVSDPGAATMAAVAAALAAGKPDRPAVVVLD